MSIHSDAAFGTSPAFGVSATKRGRTKGLMLFAAELKAEAAF
jgi:hypothetical protein